MKRRPMRTHNSIKEHGQEARGEGGEKTRIIRVRTEDVHGGMIDGRQEPDAGILQLAASIARHGLLSPVVVRKSGTAGKYALVCGARRLAACALAGIKKIDAVLVPWEGAAASACYLEEEMSRVPPSAMALTGMVCRRADAAARACAFGGERVLRLAALGGLAEPVRELARREALTLEQAEPLLELQDPAGQMEAAQIIAQRSLTPAQARRLVCAPRREQNGKRRAIRYAMEEANRLAEKMRAQGMSVGVSVHSQEGGVSIQILLKVRENSPGQQEIRERTRIN
ncbi:MAG: ParB N-terminal domain-containing protein [Clostridia bacterium]|nr:ParB N-terminal domain-containing protein [Clostridia bacterium]